MIKHILRLLIRDLAKNRITGFINILGLALALGSSFLILLFVLHEVSFNAVHKEKNRICRVLSEYSWGVNEWELMNSTPLIMAEALIREYPEIEKISRVCNHELFFGGQHIKKGEEYIHESNFLVVDSSFFEIFSFPVLYGNKNQFLRDPYDIVISEKTAAKYFEKENPVGETLIIRNYDGEQAFNVQGVFKDFPSNSTLQADLIGNMELTLSFFGDRGWGLSNVQTYILLDKKQSLATLEGKLENFGKEKHPDREQHYELQPLKKVHFHSDHLSWYQLPQGDLQRIYLLCAIGLILLLIPGINYTILATGRGMSRYLEIGVRKVNGAGKRSIATQICAESVLLLALALPVGIMVSELMLPTFNKLLNTSLEIEYMSNLPYFGGLLLITLVFGILAGTSTAVYISRFQPEDILKNRFTSKSGSSNLKRILIVCQLCIFLTLFIFTGIQYKQLKFIERTDLGFNPEGVLAIEPPHDHHLYSCRPFVESIQDVPGIESVTEVSAGIFTPVFSYLRIKQSDNADDPITVRCIETDIHFIRSHGIRILEGRDFQGTLASDSGKVLINQTAMQVLGLTEAPGEIVTDSEGRQYEVIGLISDFNIGSLHEKIPPLFVRIREPESMVCQVAVKIDKVTDMQGVLSTLEDRWDRFGPGGRFEYFFMGQRFASLYENDRRFAQTFGLFTLLAIVLASLGLFGFSVFSSFQRAKEVGIRKAFGATTKEINVFILREYIWLLVIANIVSWPLAWFFANMWLHNYAYRTSLGVTVFLMGSAISSLVLLLTVGFNTRKLAENNPVESLKYE